MFSEAEVVVIGAGAIGCSIACHLGRRGASVVVVDANDIATGTSSATLGLVWVQRKAPTEYMKLSLLSSRLHAELAPTFDEDVELRQQGGLSSYLDEKTYQDQLAILESINTELSEPHAWTITPQEAHQMEPALSPDVVGAIFSPLDGDVNPMKLTFAFADSAKKCKVRFLTHTAIEQITRDESGVTGVNTAIGSIRARAVVVAAGGSSAALVQPLGVDMPLRYERGQVLVTEALPQMMKYPTGNTKQTVHGNVMLGVTYEANITERTATAAGAKKVANDAYRRYPALKNANIIRQFAGIRSIPKDGRPYLGPVERAPGLYVATSHSGITLAPVHGKVISELILDGHTDVPIGSYRPERHMTAI